MAMAVTVTVIATPNAGPGQGSQKRVVAWVGGRSGLKDSAPKPMKTSGSLSTGVPTRDPPPLKHQMQPPLAGSEHDVFYRRALIPAHPVTVRVCREWPIPASAPTPAAHAHVNPNPLSPSLC